MPPYCFGSFTTTARLPRGSQKVAENQHADENATCNRTRDGNRIHYNSGSRTVKIQHESRLRCQHHLGIFLTLSPKLHLRKTLTPLRGAVPIDQGRSPPCRWSRSRRLFQPRSPSSLNRRPFFAFLAPRTHLGAHSHPRTSHLPPSPRQLLVHLLTPHTPQERESQPARPTNRVLRELPQEVG